MKTPEEIAREHFEDDGSDLSSSVIQSITEAIEADRAQWAEHFRPLVTAVSEAAETYAEAAGENGDDGTVKDYENYEDARLDFADSAEHWIRQYIDGVPAPEPAPELTYDELSYRYFRLRADFRQRSILHLASLIPDDIRAVLLDFTDSETPRLTVDSYILDNGETVDPYDYEEDSAALFDTLDPIACDMGFEDWEDASSYLLRTEDRQKFIITHPGKDNE